MIDLESYREVRKEAEQLLQEYQETADAIRRVRSAQPAEIRTKDRGDLSDKMVKLEKVRHRYIRKLTESVQVEGGIWRALWQAKEEKILTFDEWRVLHMRYLSFAKWDAIAEAVGRSVGYCYILHRRALKALRDAQDKTAPKNGL